MKSSTVRNIAGFAVFFGMWQLLASIGWINPVLLPSPLQLCAAAYDLTTQGILWTPLNALGVAAGLVVMYGTGLLVAK